VFSTSNLWDAKTTPPNINWANHNRGLVNHLFYTVASGDSAFGDSNIVFGGLQDNGTRWRSDLLNPTVFDQIIGGDGIGSAVSHGSAGVFFWGSSEYSYDSCQIPTGQTVDCSNPSNWTSLAPSVTVKDNGDQRPEATDASPFFVRFAPVPTDASGYGMLTITNSQLWLYAQYTPPLPANSQQTIDWETVPVTPPAGKQSPTTGSLISPDFSLQANPSGPAVISNMAAHPKAANVYGVALSPAGGGQTSPAAVTLDATQTAGGTPKLSVATTNRGSWIFAQPVTVGNTGTGHMQAPQSIAFPIQEPASGTPGKTYLLAFSSSRYSDGTAVPNSVGRLFRTTDAGQTWTSLVGTTAGHQLPNVAVWVVKYDPVTPGVIYAGTIMGVYISKDDGATWDRFGNGLPMVSVRDMFIASNSDFIRVATYGRVGRSIPTRPRARARTVTATSTRTCSSTGSISPPWARVSVPVRRPRRRRSTAPSTT
jgi:hypothetical protein